VSVPWWVAVDPLGARIYWTHWYAFSDGRVQGAPLAGSGNIDTLYDWDAWSELPGWDGD
jgi:hypothetical protein